MAALTERKGDVVEITLDWPEIRNAVGVAEGREVRLALEAATRDETVATVVISANGTAFCAGGNLPQIVELAANGPTAIRNSIYSEFQGIFRAIADSPVPVIAAVDGAAIGFGCDLALAGSMTFIGRNGWLAQGWIRAGLVPATGGTLYAARRGGPQAVWRLLSADKVDGPTAESWGLGISCDDARTAALATAEKLASLPRAPLRTTKLLADIEELQAHLDTALDHQIGFLTDPDFPAFATKLIGR